MGVPAPHQHQIPRQGQIALHQIASLSLSALDHSYPKPPARAIGLTEM